MGSRKPFFSAEGNAIRYKPMKSSYFVRIDFSPENYNAGASFCSRIFLLLKDRCEKKRGSRENFLAT
jgi:hypothetical protein